MSTNRRTLSIALTILFAVAAAASAQTTMRDYAYELMLHEDYRAALTAYGKLVKSEPDDGHLMDEYAYCLLQNKKYGKAVRAYKKAAQLHAKSGEEWAGTFRTDSLIMCGETYLSQKKPKKAMKEFQAVLDEDVTNEDVLLGIMTACIRLGYVAEAGSFCEENIRRETGNYEALAHLYFYWAQCQYALGKKERAAQGLLVSRENYIKAGLAAPDEEIDRLYELYCED